MKQKTIPLRLSVFARKNIPKVEPELLSFVSLHAINNERCMIKSVSSPAISENNSTSEMSTPPKGYKIV